MSPRRVASASAVAAAATLVLATSNQAATVFNFDYSEAPEFSNNPAAQSALTQAGQLVGSYFGQYNASIEIAVDSNNDVSEDNFLASAGSSSPGVGQPGFGNRGYVGAEIISGVDQNGRRPDGSLSVNFGGTEWDFSNNVAADRFDFVATMAHELLHTVGFSSSFDEQGRDLYETSTGLPGRWSPFDQQVGDLNGPVVNGETFVVDQERYNTASVGGEGEEGLYFHGAQAVAANGGQPVKLFSPTEFDEGSSISHLDDDFYTDTEFLLESTALAGPGTRLISDVELGILRDIGFANITAPNTDSDAVAEDPTPENPDVVSEDPAVDPVVVVEDPAGTDPDVAVEDPADTDPDVAVEDPADTDPDVAVEDPADADPDVAVEDPADTDPDVAVEDPADTDPDVAV
ncbi:MAG: hypothetical protein V3V20_04525, partial [Algisphaera sp.]